MRVIVLTDEQGEEIWKYAQVCASVVEKRWGIPSDDVVDALVIRMIDAINRYGWENWQRIRKTVARTTIANLLRKEFARRKREITFEEEDDGCIFSD